MIYTCHERSAPFAYGPLALRVIGYRRRRLATGCIWPHCPSRGSHNLRHSRPDHHYLSRSFAMKKAARRRCPQPTQKSKSARQEVRWPVTNKGTCPEDRNSRNPNLLPMFLMHHPVPAGLHVTIPEQLFQCHVALCVPNGRLQQH